MKILIVTDDWHPQVNGVVRTLGQVAQEATQFGVPVEVLSPAERAGFEFEARAFADAQGYSVDWDSVARLDDVSLINGVSQIAPFDVAAKQALLEAEDVRVRCELLVQLMQFFGRRDSGEDRVTLQ